MIRTILLTWWWILLKSIKSRLYEYPCLRKLVNETFHSRQKPYALLWSLDAIANTGST